MSTKLINYIPFRIIFLLLILLSAISWLYLLVKLAPTLNTISYQNDNQNSSDESLRFPSNLQELKSLADLLKQYKTTNKYYVVILFSSAYLFKQTFAIPGSVFMNLLAGALFGLWIGFPFCCLLTAFGATFCFLLSKYFGKKYIEKLFPKRIKLLKLKIKENKSRLIYILLFLRLFPITPNWFLNMAFPIIDIPIDQFFISVFIGLMPYNYMCVQMGCLLAQLTSIDDIFTLSTAIKLSGIAIIAIIPGLIINRKNNKNKIKNMKKQEHNTTSRTTPASAHASSSSVIDKWVKNNEKKHKSVIK